MKYILEPLLFAFDKNSTKDSLIRHLQDLLVLDDWWTAHKKEMFVLSTTGEILCFNDFYPYVDYLKPVLEKHEITFVSYKDISKMLDKFLNKTNYIDKICENEMIGLKHQSIIEPSAIITDNRPKAFHKELLKLLWYITCHRIINNSEEESYLLIAKDITGAVKTNIIYESVEEKDNKPSIVEHNVTTVINCKSSINDFLRDENSPFLLWKLAETKDDIDLGLRISVFQTKNMNSLNDVYTTCNFCIQESFFEDYCNGYYKSRPQDITSTIQAVTDAVTDQNLRKMHAIREGKSGAAKDLVVNGYSAKRRDITTSIKVSYWKKGNDYRIANMKEHDLVGISEEW